MLLFSLGEAYTCFLYTYKIAKCKTFVNKTILMDLQ